MTNKILIIDLRTPFHVREFEKILFKTEILNDFDFLVVAPKKLPLEGLNYHTLLYHTNPTSYLSIFKLWKIVKAISEEVKSYNEINLCTSIPFGPLHDLLINKIKIKKGFLFEDGISSYLDLDVKYYFLKKLLFFIFFMKKILLAKKKFFSVDLNFYETIFTEKKMYLNHLNNQKKIIDIGTQNINQNTLNVIKRKKVVFLSSASVEYGFQTFEEYEKTIKTLLECVSYKNIIVSFHHNENFIDQKLKIIKKYFRITKVLYPNKAVEDSIFNGNFNIELISPYNSTALSACNENTLKKLILYNDNGPNINKRISLFKKILPLLKFRSHTL